MTRSKDWSRSERKLTVGATAKLTADIKAREVIVYGSVKGNVRGKAKIEIKKDGSVNADLTTAQIVIKDGAYFKGSIEIEKSAEKEGDTNVFSRKASTLTALNNGNGAEDRLGSRRCFMTLTGKHALTMPFNSGSDVEARLRDPANLTSREVRDLMPWVHQISIIGERRLTAELALWNLEAAQRFERSSNKLTKYLIWVTVALVLLTVALAYCGFVLAKLALDGTESLIPPGLVRR